MRLRLLWTQRWPADCRGAGLSGRSKSFSRRCRSRSFSADYRRKKYGSQQDSRPGARREMVHLDKQRPRNHSHFARHFSQITSDHQMSRHARLFSASPCVRGRFCISDSPAVFRQMLHRAECHGTARQPQIRIYEWTAAALGCADLMFAVCTSLGVCYFSPAGAQLLSPPRKRWEAVNQMGEPRRGGTENLIHAASTSHT